jgi:hypothetical protein
MPKRRYVSEEEEEDDSFSSSTCDDDDDSSDSGIITSTKTKQNNSKRRKECVKPKSNRTREEEDSVQFVSTSTHPTTTTTTSSTQYKITTTSSDNRNNTNTKLITLQPPPIFSFEKVKTLAELYKILSRSNGNVKRECLACGARNSGGKWMTDHAAVHPEMKKILANNDAKLILQRSMFSSLPTSGAASVSIPKRTLQDVHFTLAAFIASKRLPLSFVEDPAFGELVRCVYEYGCSQQPGSRLELVSARTLTEKHIEGPDGVLVKMYNTIMPELEAALTKYQGTIAFDGAGDWNRCSTERVAIKAGRLEYFVAMGGFGADNAEGAKTGENIANFLIGVLRGDFDPNTCSLHHEDDPVEPEKLAAHLKCMREFQILCSRSMFIVSDNAAAPAKARRIIEQRLALVQSGCITHASARMFEHVIKDVIPSEDLSAFTELLEVFTQYTAPKNLLKAAAQIRNMSTRTLLWLPNTRFLQLSLAAERALSMHQPLKDTVTGNPYTELLDAGPTLLDDPKMAKMKNVKEFILSNRFEKILSLIWTISEPFLTVTRYFDQLTPNASLVYLVLNYILETLHVKLIGFEQKYQQQFDRAVYDKIKTTLLDDVNKFVHPVHSASFLMCPALRAEVLKLEQDDNQEFKARLEDTLDVLTTMHRRIDFSGKFRDAILDYNDPTLAGVRTQFLKEYQDYLMGIGNFDKISRENLDEISPVRFWRFEAGGSILRPYGLSLCHVHPSTSFVERNHKVVASVITEKRASLKMARGIGLVAMACHSASFNSRETVSDPEADFAKDLHWFRKLQEVNDMDEKILKNCKNVGMLKIKLPKKNWMKNYKKL